MLLLDTRRGIVKTDLKKIKQLRLAHHYSQDGVANYLDLSNHVSYGNKERGTRQFSVEELGKLAGLYQVSITDLLH